MCISTAYENNESGTVLAENIARVSQQDGAVILIDILGRETKIEGVLKLADLTQGILIVQPS